MNPHEQPTTPLDPALDAFVADVVGKVLASVFGAALETATGKPIDSASNAAPVAVSGPIISRLQSTTLGGHHAAPVTPHRILKHCFWDSWRMPESLPYRPRCNCRRRARHQEQTETKGTP